MNRVTINQVKSLKNMARPFSAITAYDYTSAKIIDCSDIPIVLVGDSASMVSYGYSTTLPISMNEILIITRAVCRATKRALVVGDMPFLSYQTSLSAAVKNAGLLLKEGGAGAVKLEGGAEIVPQIKKIVSSGIPVMGHLGLTPQSINTLSGYSVQGKTLEAAQKIVDDARKLESAGVFSIVLECVPAQLADHITNMVSIPTIGIGSGLGCNGQIQVFHDVLGLSKNFHPKHAKKYLNLHKQIGNALKKYSNEVASKKFPSPKHSFKYKKNIVDQLK